MKKEIHNVYDAEEFESWAAAKDLQPEEETLFGRYLHPLPKDLRILDLGTGAGKFVFALRKHGFRHLAGVDLSPRLIGVANAKCVEIGAETEIQFSQQSVCAMNLPDESQDVVMALQQITSLLEEPADRMQALREMYRVLTPGGMLLASFLSWEGRRVNPSLGAAILPVKLLKGDIKRLKKNYLPFLKLGNRLNISYLYSQQPYTYWFTRSEVEQRLSEVSFEILDITTSRMLVGGSPSFAFGGFLYVIARKPRKQ